MALSFAEFVADGAVKTFTVPFPYLEESHVNVYVDGTKLTESEYSFLSPTTVEITVAPTNGVIVRLERDTSIDSKAVEFAAKSLLRSEDLSKATDQLLFALQEREEDETSVLSVGLDGKYDFGNRVGINLNDPTDDQDATNVRWVRSIVDSKLANVTELRNDAIAAADEAQTSAQSSALSSQNAQASKDAADDARDSALAAVGAAQAASASAALNAELARTTQEAIDGLYLGSQSSAPTTDLLGNPLVSGNWYFDTAMNAARIYANGAWNTATSSFVDVTGTVTATTVTADLTGDVTGNVTGNVTGDVTGALSAGDNVKAQFGDGNDLQIYHDGSNSYIKDAGTGNLIIDATDLRLRSNSGEVFLKATENDAVELRHNNSAKLATTSTGVDVTGTVVADAATITGTVTADGLTVDGNVEVSSANAILRLMETDTTDVNTTLRTSSGNFRIQSTNDAKSTNTQRLTVDHATGDISFYEDTGTTAKFFWDASAERLGIGTSSPVSELHIENAVGATGDVRVTLDTGSGSTSGQDAQIYSYRSNAALILGTNNAERMRIDSCCIVGIGTDSPSRNYGGTVACPSLTSTGSTIHLTDGTSGSGANDGTDFLHYGTDTYITNRESTGATRFYNGGSERARIDSSGNLLVGRTSQLTDANMQAGGTGTEIGSILRHSRTGGTPVIFNRNTDDGDIVALFKDGTTVGSIRSRSGVVSTLILDPRPGGNGITGTSTGFYPVDQTGDAKDAGVNLGTASVRFKDLYLSGGVYLGGTGSANHLDDYEEGTWTPTSGVALTLSTDNRYVKIGRLVVITYDITFASSSSGSAAIVSNLPFSVPSSERGSGIVGWSDSGSNDSIHVSGTNFTFRYNGNTERSYSQVAGDRFIGQIIYRTS